MGRGGDDETKTAAKAACCCCVLIISVTLFACSFSILTPHEIGLHYNGVTFYVHPETTFNGRYFLGLGHGFHKYPRKLQYVEFSDSTEGGIRNQAVSMWSRDGQSVVLEIGFYYKLIPESLNELYFTFKDDYLRVIEDIALNAFRDVGTQYDTIAFFVNRASVNDAMQAELNARLMEQAFATVERFNLLRVDMADAFEDAVEDKVVAQQEKNILEFEQQSAVIRRNILVLQAEAQRNITIIMAESQHNGTVIESQAKASAFASLTKRAADFRLQLARDLGFNYTAAAPATEDYDRLLQFMYLDIVKGATAGRSRVAVNVDSLLLNT